MASIRQNQYPNALPDFRNLGVMARALLFVNLLAILAAAAAESDWNRAFDMFVVSTVLIEPPLLASLLLLLAAAPLLRRLPYWLGSALVLALVLALTAGTHALFGAIAGISFGRALAFAGVATVLVLAYLNLHLRAHSPALAEARLQALQARIRPHFLFNSLNAVLALIRSDPRRAERTLEDLADLFRALMSDGRSLVRVADEIALIERYAAIEQLRLGERLRMSWDMDQAPVDALLPPLVLQPLLENAVYHGVEPGTGVSDVLVRIERRGDRVHVRIENPAQPAGTSARAGNHMALDNIRERLMLFFDADARLEAKLSDGRYCVDLDLPYRTGRA
jgi:two-component system sensor histidine kinase AlgZ